MATQPKHFRINTSQKFEFRAASDTAPASVQGHAAVFNAPSQPLYELGGAREMILRGAFTNALARPDDVRLLVNHDPSLILARNTAGTLILHEDEVGLFFSATLPDTTYANDLKASMARGDISQCSFGFCIEDGGMDLVNGEPMQTIRSVSLSDVSIVTYPAYTQTDASLRSEYLSQIEALINKQVDDGSSTRMAVDSANAKRKREIELLELY